MVIFFLVRFVEFYSLEGLATIALLGTLRWALTRYAHANLPQLTQGMLVLLFLTWPVVIVMLFWILVRDTCRDFGTWKREKHDN